MRVQGGKFVVGPDCKPFYISGWNSWEAMEAAAGALELFGASLPENTTGPALIRNVMERAQHHGLNVVRIWAHPVSAPYALQTAPGKYNEAVFRGLDYRALLFTCFFCFYAHVLELIFPPFHAAAVLDEARKRGIRVLLTLVDNWQPTGGADQFLGWVGSSVHEDFFSNRRVKQLYKDHVRVILERKNSVNGREYRNDPTIFAYNLINEPRCYRCSNVLTGWISEMASWVKSIDSNHLLTVGEEGFYPEGATQKQKLSNPQRLESWAFWEGQDFARDHSSPLIDFASIHLWIHNWEDPTEDFAKRWLKQHIEDARALGKPLLLEEFGAWGSGRFKEERTKWYKLIYDIVVEDARSGGPMAGALFWQWFAANQQAPAEEGGNDGGLFGVFDTDETWTAVAEFTAEMKSLSEKIKIPSECSAAAAGAAAGSAGAGALLKVKVPRVCTPGVEGDQCNVDINECARGTADCDRDNSACINTAGSYECRCYLGFSGNGKSCAPTPQLSSILEGYKTLGAGKVACKEGTDVAYPDSAPGFADDVMGALENKFGSRVAVTPQQCMLACSMVAQSKCDSFSYNPEQKKCFLKYGASPEVCQVSFFCRNSTASTFSSCVVVTLLSFLLLTFVVLQKPETLCVTARGSPYSCGFWQTYFNVSAVSGRPPMVMAAEGPPALQTDKNSSILLKPSI